jgi:hypothetical protein
VPADPERGAQVVRQPARTAAGVTPVVAATLTTLPLAS